jgi:hypothetical protein
VGGWADGPRPGCCLLVAPAAETDGQQSEPNGPFSPRTTILPFPFRPADLSRSLPCVALSRSPTPTSLRRRLPPWPLRRPRRLPQPPPVPDRPRPPAQRPRRRTSSPSRTSSNSSRSRTPSGPRSMLSRPSSYVCSLLARPGGGVEGDVPSSAELGKQRRIRGRDVDPSLSHSLSL